MTRCRGYQLPGGTGAMDVFLLGGRLTRTLVLSLKLLQVTEKRRAN